MALSSCSALVTMLTMLLLSLFKLRTGELGESPPTNDFLQETMFDQGMASDVPSDSPSMAPSDVPSLSPSSNTPSDLPSLSPAFHIPSFQPGDLPSSAPSSSPTSHPTSIPTDVPTFVSGDGITFISREDIPSYLPVSAGPRGNPTSGPSGHPISAPNEAPGDSQPSDNRDVVTNAPSSVPISEHVPVPSGNPTLGPSGHPISAPNEAPDDSQTSDNRDVVTNAPSSVPISEPSTAPSRVLSLGPSTAPSDNPTSTPSTAPSHVPSLGPSAAPSDNPTPTPSAVPSLAPSSTPTNVPSLSPSASPVEYPTMVPSPPPSIFPSDVPSSMPSFMPSDLPSWGPSSVPSDMPSLGPSSAPTDFGFDILPGIGQGSDETSSRDAPAIEDGGASDSSPSFWSIVGGAATVGAFLAILVVLLLVRHRRRERSTSQSQLPIIIPGIGENGYQQDGTFQDGVLSISLDSRFKPDSTKSMEIASRSNDQDDMLPVKALGVPSIVESMHNDEVKSEMSPMSATVDDVKEESNGLCGDAKEESNGLCGCLDAANSEDAYIDGLEDPSFGETDKALNDLRALEKTRSYDSQSQNSSLKGLELVGTKSKEEKAENSGAVGFLKDMFGFRKEKPKPPLRDQAHYFNNDEPCKSDEVSYDFEQHQGTNGVVSDANLAPTASTMMTPKRSNRSNGSVTGNPRRFFRGSASKTFEDNTKL